MNTVFAINDIDGHLIRAMATSVLEQAVQDHYQFCKAEKAIKRVYRELAEQAGDNIPPAVCASLERLRETIAETRDAAEWLESNSTEVNSLLWCCRMLDIDEEETRHQALTCDFDLRRRLAHKREALRHGTKDDTDQDEYAQVVASVEALVESLSEKFQMDLFA